MCFIPTCTPSSMLCRWRSPRVGPPAEGAVVGGLVAPQPKKLIPLVSVDSGQALAQESQPSVEVFCFTRNFFAKRLWNSAVYIGVLSSQPRWKVFPFMQLETLPVGAQASPFSGLLCGAWAALELAVDGDEMEFLFGRGWADIWHHPIHYSFFTDLSWNCSPAHFTIASIALITVCSWHFVVFSSIIFILLL